MACVCKYVYCLLKTVALSIVINAIMLKFVTLWWFIGKLDRRLQEVYGKFGVDLRGDPHSKAFVDTLDICDRIQQLVQEVQTQVTILQEQPASISHALRQQSAGMDLLALSHGDWPAWNGLG